MMPPTSGARADAYEWQGFQSSTNFDDDQVRVTVRFTGFGRVHILKEKDGFKPLTLSGSWTVGGVTGASYIVRSDFPARFDSSRSIVDYKAIHSPYGLYSKSKGVDTPFLFAAFDIGGERQEIKLIFRSASTGDEKFATHPEMMTYHADDKSTYLLRVRPKSLFLTPGLPDADPVDNSGGPRKIAYE
jgi:hypothetical protein